MKLAMLTVLALVIGLGNSAHAGCVGTRCTTDERTTTATQAIDATLGSRIDNALKDLEIANARALKADQERMNALCAAVNCADAVTPADVNKQFTRFSSRQRKHARAPGRKD